MLFCFVKRGWEEGGFKAAIAVMQGNYHVGCRGLKAALNIPHLSESFVSRQSQNNGGWLGSAAGTPILTHALLSVGEVLSVHISLRKFETNITGKPNYTFWMFYCFHCYLTQS